MEITVESNLRLTCLQPTARLSPRQSPSRFRKSLISPTVIAPRIPTTAITRNFSSASLHSGFASEQVTKKRVKQMATTETAIDPPMINALNRSTPGPGRTARLHFHRHENLRAVLHGSRPQDYARSHPQPSNAPPCGSPLQGQGALRQA